MIIFELLYGKLEIGIALDGVIGFCFNDKYCYTTTFGFEKLK